MRGAGPCGLAQFASKRGWMETPGFGFGVKVNMDTALQPGAYGGLKASGKRASLLSCIGRLRSQMLTHGEGPVDVGQGCGHDVHLQLGGEFLGG